MAPTADVKQRRGVDCDIPVDDVIERYPNQKLVGVDGKWYDVTDFVDKHPGGPVMKKFLGQDATTAFHAFGHKNWVLKHRKPVGYYKRRDDPVDRAFDKLRDDFVTMGFFETDHVWYAKKMAVTFLLFTTAVCLTTQFSQWYVHYLAAVALAFFWQQCGFIMHEYMHSQVYKSFDKDYLGGLFFGTVCFGFSSSWWRDEHILHHALTNVVDTSTRFIDPQMWESVWAQNIKMFPFYTTRLQYWLIKIQHFTFVPFVTLAGRYEIVLDSFLFQFERRWYEWVAWMFHWLWLCTLLSYLPTWKEVTVFYIIASSVEGIFHFQLILSHYCKLFANIDEFHDISWYRFQIESNMNIDCPLWLDWYYGGLQFHIEHHLFPMMSRNKLRSASPHVRALCERLGIDYDSCSFTRAMVKTLQHLKVSGTHFKLDPR